MMPSNLSMMSWRLSTACGFSILAMTGSFSPSSSMISCTRRMSSPERTKDSAMMSTPVRRAQRRSFSSFSVSAGTETAALGMLMPLWSETFPPITTRVVTVVAETSVASRRTLPSSISSRSPGRTSPGRPL